jgi:hypothetical protein
MTQRISHVVRGNVQTTDAATATIVVSYDLSSAAASPSGVAWDGCSVNARCVISGKQAGNTVAGEVLAVFRRTAGTLAQVGAAAGIGTLFSDAALANSTVTIDASGNLIRVRVTGVVATTIDWSAFLYLWSNEP